MPFQQKHTGLITKNGALKRRIVMNNFSWRLMIVTFIFGLSMLCFGVALLSQENNILWTIVGFILFLIYMAIPPDAPN